MIKEIKHYNLEVLRHSETKVGMKGKQIDGANYVHTRVLEGGTKCSVKIVVMGKLGGVHQKMEVCQ